MARGRDNKPLKNKLDTSESRKLGETLLKDFDECLSLNNLEGTVDESSGSLENGLQGGRILSSRDLVE